MNATQVLNEIQRLLNDHVYNADEDTVNEVMSGMNEMLGKLPDLCRIFCSLK